MRVATIDRLGFMAPLVPLDILVPEIAGPAGLFFRCTTVTGTDCVSVAFALVAGRLTQESRALFCGLSGFEQVTAPLVSGP